MTKIGLAAYELEQILAILESVPAVNMATIFGSRATGLARPNSDVDIMLYGDDLLLQDIAQISSLLDETTLPYQFDLILHKNVDNHALMEHVKQYGIVIFQRS
jgi:O-succinylbenzoate synthase